MLQLSQCKLSWQEDSFSKLQKKAAKLLGISVEDFTQFTIVKRSLDARKKPNLFVLYTVRFSCRRESEVLKRNRKNKNLTIAQKEPSLWRQIEEIKNPERVVVVGAGPAGLFVYVVPFLISTVAGSILAFVLITVLSRGGVLNQLKAA